MKRLRIGCGAGFADDRIEPAAELAAHGGLDYLVFECLAERTVALAQLDKLRDPGAGYNEWLRDRMEAVLESCARHGVRIITNMGAANPVAAARVVAEVARGKGIRGLKIAAVTGDDVLDAVKGSDLPLLERADDTIASLGDAVISANAYLGTEPVIQALRQGADVVVGGRIADPALFLAPLTHEFGWSAADWPLLGAGTAAGHLLECGGQATGGYFADPGVKDVPGLARLGFPIAEVREDGFFEVTKLPGSGGRVSVATLTEQLLYEVHDPAAYVTPDVVADFSGAMLEQSGEDRVAVTGLSGRPRPDNLKVSVGYRDSWIGEGEISYSGPGCVARGRLALDIVRERLALTNLDVLESRFDLIGVDAVRRGTGTPAAPEPAEVRARVAVRTRTHGQARRAGHEVTALWLNGPYGGGGAARRTYEDIAVVSVLIPRASVATTVTMLEPAA
jgi:Acyclic terpene utilisation family protein AtuA